MVQGGHRINPAPRRSNGKAFTLRILSEPWPANSRFNSKDRSVAEPQPNTASPPGNGREAGNLATSFAYRKNGVVSQIGALVYLVSHAKTPMAK
jgi:hypothetical protein